MIPSLDVLPFGTVSDLGWTLVHFLWQGLVCGALLRIILPLCRTAAARHGWSLATAILMALLPVATFLYLHVDWSIASPAAQTHYSSAEAVGAGFIAGAIPTPWMYWVVTLWLCGVAAFSLRALGGWYLAESLRRRDTSPLSADVLSRCRALQQRLAISSPVRFLQSRAVRSLVVVGWFRPVILIPVAAITGLPPLQLDALIAHELAHIRRLDAFTNLLLVAIETVLFYHPAVWWVTRRVRQEREHCCDDVAVSICGDAGAYVDALATLETLRVDHFALAASHGSLKQRAARLLGMLPEPRAFSMSSLAGLALVCLVGVGLATAQSSLQPTSQTFAMRSVDDSHGPGTDRVPTAKPGGSMPESFWLKREGQVTLDMLKSAQAVMRQGNWVVEFTLTPEGTDRFAALTRANVDGQIGVVVDGAVVSAPRVRSPIVGGRGFFEGNFTEQEARTLADALMKSKPPSPKAAAREPAPECAATVQLGCNLFLTRITPDPPRASSRVLPYWANASAPPPEPMPRWDVLHAALVRGATVQLTGQFTNTGAVKVTIDRSSGEPALDRFCEGLITTPKWLPGTVDGVAERMSMTFRCGSTPPDTASR